MWNQKDLYSFFLVLMVVRVICLPVSNNTCKFPPELLSLVTISQLDDTLKYCLNVDSDDDDNTYCQEIAIFIKELNNCSIGEIWKTQELKSELINKSKQIPFDTHNDICWNFKNLKTYIDFAGMNENSLGSQFSSNKDLCDMFCDRSDYLDNCKLLLNLYWIKGTLRHTNREIGKEEISQNSSPQSTLHESSTVKINSESNFAKIKETNAVASEKSPKNNKIIPEKDNQVDKAAFIQPEKINKTISKANNHSQSPSNKITPEGQNEMTTVKKDTSITIKQPNKNTKDKNSIQSIPVNNPTISAEKVASQTTEDNSKNSASNIKNDISDNKDTSKSTVKINNLDLPETVPESLPKPIDKSSPEAENDFNPDTEKNEEAEFGKQVNKFGDELSDPGNDYGDDEPPPDSTFNVEKDETQKKQSEVLVNPGANMKPLFPEEEDSHFFAYFLTIVVLCIAGYLVFHNKQKIIALIIEGRHERRRRPNGGGYKRLDNKDSAKATSQVIF